MFDRLFSRSRQKISKKFFPTRFAGYPDRRLWQKKKSAPARIFTISSEKTFHKETKSGSNVS
ncbi:TPA: hypothetical protein ACYX99_002821 [Klebsiella pneumoniae]|uniref:Uncharacterized protein n=1 Tax=Klebsiella pneumoniae TaxID=573 RepID=A0A483J8L1_KLEPN|nr:hypothetical protein [Klebsiella pneumoniae]HDU3731938.1 hypothetical protein [Klebsiella pneumoniae subsp. pneumoniae]APV17021.1 hypothetical protein BWG70_03255 [Klebsiella pneumoniae]EIW9342214.1 hypothetical protein [Klebsiella pneumoniae]ELA2210714.1 hypothetical protein [Klebsiella pneumoniae]MBX7523941.1 hypothetical protein [Klebsiella pneumoniae]